MHKIDSRKPGLANGLAPSAGICSAGQKISTFPHPVRGIGAPRIALSHIAARSGSADRPGRRPRTTARLRRTIGAPALSRQACNLELRLHRHGSIRAERLSARHNRQLYHPPREMKQKLSFFAVKLTDLQAEIRLILASEPPKARTRYRLLRRSPVDQPPPSYHVLET
jgi:hypothetical protein